MNEPINPHLLCSIEDIKCVIKLADDLFNEGRMVESCALSRVIIALKRMADCIRQEMSSHK